VAEFLPYRRVRCAFRHANSTSRIVIAVGSASVDTTRGATANCRRFLEPCDRARADFCFAFKLYLVAAGNPGHENQHSKDGVNSDGEFDVFDHDQKLAIPGNC